jgi:hypothetical protein
MPSVKSFCSREVKGEKREKDRSCHNTILGGISISYILRPFSRHGKRGCSRDAPEPCNIEVPEGFDMQIKRGPAAVPPVLRQITGAMIA